MNIKQIAFFSILKITTFSAILTSVIPTPIVRNLAVYDKTIYAEVKYIHSYLDENTVYFYSTDGGQNWAKVGFQLPTEVIKQLSKSEELPLKLCLLENQDICYQTDDESILESNDGGETWFISWDIPEGRREFLKRKSFGVFEIGPFDFVQLEVNNRQIVIATFGTEGLLIKEDNNQWKSIGLSNAGPMYFSATSFAEAKYVITREFYLLFCVAILFFYINLQLNIIKKRSFWHYLLFIAPFFTTGLILFLMIYTLKENSSFTFYYSITFLASLLLSIVVILQQFFTNTKKRAKINLILIIFVATISYSVLILWAYGVIQVIKIALWIAISLHILLLLWILYLPIKEFIQTKISHPKSDLHE